MSEIRPQHWSEFMKLCAEVEATGIALDLPNIRQVLFDKNGGQFHPGKTLICSAMKGSLSDQANAMRLQLWAMSCGAPQERAGFDNASLALKIVDQTRTRPGGGMHFPIALDVLRSGRRVLEIYGLRLDSEQDDNCRYSPRGSLLDDLGNMLLSIPEYDALVRVLIELFPGEGKRLKKTKKLVLDELAQSTSN